MLKCNHDYTLFSRSWVCTSKISVAEERLFFKIFQCGPSHAHDTAVTAWSVLSCSSDVAVADEFSQSCIYNIQFWKSLGRLDGEFASCSWQLVAILNPSDHIVFLLKLLLGLDMLTRKTCIIGKYIVIIMINQFTCTWHKWKRSLPNNEFGPC